MLQDRSFIEQMKADILRRVEEISDEDEEDQEGGFEDDIDGMGGVKVVGDGEESEDDDEGEGEASKVAPETICELAYIRDPKLFDRDGQTRRSKARADLKSQTGAENLSTGSVQLIAFGLQGGQTSSLWGGELCLNET
jgi:activating signal cointegrator complex subunit 2